MAKFRYPQTLIHELDKTVNPAGVEGSMRLQYGTLSHLSREDFKREIQIAKAAEREEPGFLEGVAKSYGLAKDFENWQREMVAKKLGPRTRKLSGPRANGRRPRSRRL